MPTTGYFIYTRNGNDIGILIQYVPTETDIAIMRTILPHLLRHLPQCRWRRRRVGVALLILAVMVVAFSVRLSHYDPTHYEPLTMSGILQYSNIKEEREPKQVFIYPHLKCKEHETKNTVVMVLSKTSNSFRRETIRQTWGNAEVQLKYNFSLYFVLDNDVDLPKLHIENEDILHVAFNEDNYRNTEKLIEAFNWVTHYCNESHFFFKIDDDVYFNLQFLQEVHQDETYLPDDIILGSGILEAKPCRVTSKLCVSHDEYPFDMYPPYCDGSGYVMTIHTAHKLYREMIYTKTFKFEDIYVGLVAYKLGIQVKDIDHFVYSMEGYLHYFYIECARITHNLTPEFIIKLWNERDKKTIGGRDCSALSEKARYILQIVFGFFSG